MKKVRTVYMNSRRERLESWFTRIASAIALFVTLGLGSLFLIAPSILL